MEWLDPLLLARWQFGLTTLYHYLFVPLTLGMGLVVAIFQALTQIHEMTLTFIPKIGATILALALFGPWMLQKFLNYTIALFEAVPGVVH